MIHEFTSVFSTNLHVGLPRNSFWRKQAFVDRKQVPRFAQCQPKGYFQMKGLDRTIEAIVPMNERWRRLNANMRQYVPLRANMDQHCSLTAVQRKTACVEESWWPELNLFGSMPLCSFPWHTLLPRLMQNNCCTVYSLNLIHEFTSLFRRSDFCRFAKESLPTEVGKGRHWTSVFFCGCTSRSQDSPKASPMAIFKWKNLIGQLNHTEPIARMNVEWKLEKAECQHVANPTCAITC